MQYHGLTGKVVTPGDAEYERARQEYNKAVDAYPAVIVYCEDHGDVANAIRWSQKNGIGLRVRSGGHNYQGYSTGTGELVIDTSFMNGVKVDTAAGAVLVQAGTRLLPLYERLYAHGYPFPGGTCPTVAISGLVLGGGIGLSARHFGLTADSLQAAEIVDAGGTLLEASPDCNPRLYWALRGAGGGNFGVVTTYKFRLPETIDKITLIQLRWDDSKAAKSRFLETWQKWLPGLDRRLSAFGGIYRRGAWVNAFFYGQPEEVGAILAPLLALPGLTLEKIAYVPFIDAVKTIAAGYPRREAFQTAGRFVHRQFTAGELENLLAIMDAAPSARDSSLRVYSLGGAVRDTAVRATAFFYRQADYILAITSSWENPGEAPAHQRWVKEGYDYIHGLTRGSYANFPYAPTPNYLRAYYGGHLQRLERVKQHYDPADIFNFPQSIKLP